jgi:hypothetical protein
MAKARAIEVAAASFVAPTAWTNVMAPAAVCGETSSASATKRTAARIPNRLSLFITLPGESKGKETR